MHKKNWLFPTFFNFIALNRLLVLVLIILTSTVCLAQQIAVDTISFVGLKRTRPYLLSRELTFQQGDTILLKDIQDIFAINEKRLQNTGLFVEVRMNVLALDMQEKKAHIQINLKEALFIYPAPLLEFLDNDFNKWWRNYDRSLKTLSYGLYIKHINLTGNGDEMTLYGQAGFTRKISLDYDFPFANKSNTLGFGFTTFYSANKEIAYKTKDNYLQFERDLEKDQLRRTKVGVRAVYRPKLVIRHHILLNYYSFKGSDSLTQFYNRDYFNGQSKLKFLELEYAAVFDTRDIVPYAMKGDHIIAYVNKTGFSKNNDIKVFYAGLLAYHYTSISSRWSLENIGGGRFNFDRGKVPYYFNKALGYDDLYLRGYEYYVVDGQDYAFVKNSIRFMFFDKKFEWGKAMFLQAYRTMPVKAFLTANVDAGYVSDRFYSIENSLSNSALIGYGLGLDLVFYYNKLLRFEVTRNHIGQTGFYVHFDAGL